jgi:hypothetical protein
MIGKYATIAAMALGAMTLVGCTGSGSGSSAAEINRQIAREEAWRGQDMPVMHEVTHKDKLYVVGSKKAADALAEGKMPKQTMKAFGFGPKGETVIFEDNKIGMADILVEQYEAKYGKKK